MKETEARVTLKFERNQNPTIKLIWQTILALILFYGILLSYMQCIELQRTQKVILFLAGCAMIFMRFIKQFFKTTKMVFVGSGGDWHPYGNCRRTSQYFSGLSWNFKLLYWMVESEVSVGSQSNFC